MAPLGQSEYRSQFKQSWSWASGFSATSYIKPVLVVCWVQHYIHCTFRNVTTGGPQKVSAALSFERDFQTFSLHCPPVSRREVAVTPTLRTVESRKHHVAMIHKKSLVSYFKSAIVNITSPIKFMVNRKLHVYYNCQIFLMETSNCTQN